MNRNTAKKPTKPRRAPAPAVLEDEDDDDLELAGGTELEEDVDEELEALRHELGEDVNRGRVVVHKVVQNGDPQRCFACPLSQFFSDTIREQWGAGTYSYMVYVGNKLKTRGRITFAQPLAPSTPASTSSPAARDERSLSDLEARFEQRLEREQARHFELLKMLTGNRPQLDPLQMQSQILTMLTTVKELTGARGDDQGRTSIDLFLEGVRMAQKFGGGEGGTDWGAIVASVVEGARALSQEQRRGAPRALPSPQPNGTAPATPATAAETDEDADMMGKLTKALQFLVKKAQGGADPDLYAEVVMDNITELPSFAQAILLDYLGRKDCLERLIQLEPAIAQHREWFTQLVTEIRRVLSEQTAPQPLTGEGAPPDSHA